jgi:hypothetical protein
MRVTETRNDGISRTPTVRSDLYIQPPPQSVERVCVKNAELLQHVAHVAILDDELRAMRSAIKTNPSAKNCEAPERNGGSESSGWRKSR